MFAFRQLPPRLCSAEEALHFLSPTINSQGLREPLMFLTIHKDDPTFSAGVEWGPLFLVTMTPAFPALVCGIFAIIALALPKVSWWRLVMVLLLGYAASQHGRFSKMFLLIGAMAAAHHLPIVAERLAKRPRLRANLARGLSGIAALVAALLLFGSHGLASQAGLGLDPGAYPVDACNEARSLQLEGRMYNSFDAGSYLMYCLPQHPLMIDQRAAELYDAAFYRHFLQSGASPEAVRAFADEWNVGWAFVVSYDVLGLRMDEDPAKWRLVYFDDEARIYVERERNPGLAAVGLTHHHPTRVGHLLFTPAAELPEAQRELAVLRHQTATGTQSRLMAAAFAFARGQPVAEDELRSLSLHRPEQSQLRRAILALQRGDAEAAFALLQTLVPPEERAVLRVEFLARAGRFDDAERMLALVPKDDHRAKAYLDERRR